MDFSPRQKKILNFIIREYSRDSEPVSSLELQEKCFDNLSPATLRRELSFLSENKYLSQPHTSAGRIPTDKAYRWFVEETVNNEKEMEKQSNKWAEKIQENKKNSLPVQMIAKFCNGLGVSVSLNGEISKFGLKNLLAQLHETTLSDIERIFEDIESLDLKMNEFFDEFGEMERVVFIGRESPLTRSKNLSVISRFFDTDNGPQAFLLIGSKNMLYDRNLAILEAISGVEF